MPEVSETEKALTKVESDNLSQLVARILQQLAVSAWLPSAALVLATAFLLQLGTALRAATVSPGQSASQPSAVEIVATAFAALGRMSIGGAIVMIASVVVLTMLTQAFTFEAIRILEGYWGTSEIAEDFACRRCADHSAIRQRMTGDLAILTDDAWAKAKARLVKMRRKEPDVTRTVLRVLEARVKGHTRPPVQLTESQQHIVDAFRLKDFAPRELIRRRTSILRRLADYPEDHRVMPTRLGNVLRHYEDETGVDSIQSLVEEVFDKLPGSLQVSHDEQRGRLDLYCSMTLVCIALAPVSVVLIGVHQPAWAFTAAACCLLGAVLTYRAAIASARHYGSLLPTIATFRVSTGPKSSNSN